MKSSYYCILWNWIIQRQSTCCEEITNVDKWHNSLIFVQNAYTSMIRRRMNCSWKHSMHCLFHALSTTSSWHFMVAYLQNWKQLMIWKTYRGFRSHLVLVFSVIFYGLIRSKTKRDPVHRNLFRMMFVDVLTSLDKQQQINSCIKTSYYRYWEHMRHNLMAIKCTNGMVHKNFQ